MQRFVGGFPIHARRFSAAEQLWRWSRRNPALAWTTATTLVLLVTVAADSTWGFVAARSANHELTVERARTQVEADRAEDNLRLALQAFEEIVDADCCSHFQSDWRGVSGFVSIFDVTPGVSAVSTRNPVRDGSDAIAMLERLAAKYPGNPDYQFQLADALALASPEIQRFESAVEAAARCSRSIEIARKLQSQFPNAPEYDILLANSLRRLSGLQNDQEQLKASQVSVDEAVSILRRLTEVWPEHAIYRLSLARALLHSAMLERRLKSSDLSLQRLDEAVALFDKIESFGEKPTFETAMLSMIQRFNGVGLNF